MSYQQYQPTNNGYYHNKFDHVAPQNTVQPQAPQILPSGNNAFYAPHSVQPQAPQISQQPQTVQSAQSITYSNPNGLFVNHSSGPPPRCGPNQVQLQQLQQQQQQNMHHQNIIAQQQQNMQQPQYQQQQYQYQQQQQANSDTVMIDYGQIPHKTAVQHQSYDSVANQFRIGNDQQPPRNLQTIDILNNNNNFGPSNYTPSVVWDKPENDLNGSPNLNSAIQGINEVVTASLNHPRSAAQSPHNVC